MPVPLTSQAGPPGLLARTGVGGALDGAPRAGRSRCEPARTAAAARPRERRPWPEWVQYRPNQVWAHDVTHFSRCLAAPNCCAVIDSVSRKWIRALLSAEETSTQTQVVFRDAVEAENLIGHTEDRPDTGEFPDPDQIPILLAVCDNGAPMTADATKAFMALCSIAQHLGRPATPTDQAPIESFFGHIKRGRSHLEAISDPEILSAELERARIATIASGTTRPSGTSHPPNSSDAANNNAKPPDSHYRSPTSGGHITWTHNRVPLNRVLGQRFCVQL